MVLFCKKFIVYFAQIPNSVNRQYISILLACKCETDIAQGLINIRDRGGLWKVKKVFLHCELVLRSITILVCKHMVKEILENCSLLEKKVQKQV